MKEWHMLRAHWLWCLAFLVLGLFLALGWRARTTSAPDPTTMSRARTDTPTPGPAQPETKTGLLIDLGNKKCPVMGGDVDGETYFEWSNLRVGFCCPGCDGRFLEDPEAALDKTSPKWREALAAIDAYRNAAPEHKAHQLASLAQQWTVVRESKR